MEAAAGAVEALLKFAHAPGPITVPEDTVEDLIVAADLQQFVDAVPLIASQLGTSVTRENCLVRLGLAGRYDLDALAKAAAPRIKVEVYQLDELDRLDIAGYGMVHLPLSTGTHSLEIHCWRPAGSWYENLSAKFKTRN